MRAVVQRVTRSRVRVDSESVGEIGTGLLVLLGVADGDDDAAAEALAEKIVHLRIFEDDNGRMNRSVQAIGGAILVVSQFTLLADCRKGRRPSFTNAAAPEMAERLYAVFVRSIERHGIPVALGRFGAHMAVSLINDGPVTFVLDTADLTGSLNR